MHTLHVYRRHRQPQCRVQKMTSCKVIVLVAKFVYNAKGHSKLEKRVVKRISRFRFDNGKCYKDLKQELVKGRSIYYSQHKANFFWWLGNLAQLFQVG